MNLFIFNFEPLHRATRLPMRDKRWLLLVLAAMACTLCICTYLLPDEHRNNHMTQAVNSIGPHIQTLAIGASRIYCGLNPKDLDHPHMNAAADAMDYTFNQSVLAAWLVRLPNLRLAIIETDLILFYLNSFDRYEGDYSRLFDLDADIGALDNSSFNKLTLRLLQLKEAYNGGMFAKHKLAPIDLISLEEDRSTVDHPGFQTSSQVIDPLDDAMARLARHHQIVGTLEDTAHLQRNIESLTNMIDQLLSRDVKVVLITTPKHDSYLKNRPPTWPRRFQYLIEPILQAYGPSGVIHWDLESDSTFNDQDFRDADHLNSKGATKLTRIINQRVNQMLIDSK